MFQQRELHPASLDSRCYILPGFFSTPGGTHQFQPQQDALAYFRKTVETHKTLSSYASLASAGILPSLTQTYTLEQIQAALTKEHGFEVNVNCQGSVFEEIW